MKRLILMIQFLTRLPIKVNLDVDEKDFKKGSKYFSLVGLILGLLYYALGNILNILTTNYMIISLVILIFSVIITGGIHLDGLADTFDGLYSYRDKDRILEIMKDSRVGTNGVLVLIFDILIKFILICSIIQVTDMKFLILMPVFGRLSIALAARFSRYARNNGMGAFFIGSTSNLDIFINFAILIFAVFISATYLQELLILLFIPFIYISHCKKYIDGMTGDTLGALCEITEIIYLLIVAIRW